MSNYPNFENLIPLELHNVSIYKGDITDLKVDAIVNAANAKLTGCNIKNHCIDSAIHINAGPELFKYTSEKYPNGCPTGDALISPGFDLKSKYVIHTVAPIYNCYMTDPEFLNSINPLADSSKVIQQKIIEQQSNLTDCYLNCLKLCAEQKIDSIAFCCLGTGIYKYPTDEAAVIALYTTYKYLLTVYSYPKKIIFCTFTDENYNLYKTLLPKFFKLQSQKLIPLTKKVWVTYRQGMMGSMNPLNFDITKTTFKNLMDLEKGNWSRVGINLEKDSEHYWINFLNFTVFEGLKIHGIDPERAKFSITIYD
jgi:O-acetyl-ADP-ribose deacetylase (regulator of RNase III)